MRLSILLLAPLAISIHGAATAQCLETLLVPASAAMDHQVGWALASAGDTLVVAPRPYGYPAAGAVYVFEHTAGAWVQTQTVVPSQPGVSSSFGGALALDGAWLAVGTAGYPLGGAVYVFERSGGMWIERQILRASDLEAGDAFGVSVAIDGDRMLVGNHVDDDGAPQAGAVYVFERGGGTWIERAKLVPGDAQPVGSFGLAVDLDGDRAAVGARGMSPGGISDAGKAYVLERIAGSWVEVAGLLDPVPEPADLFGESIALDGDRVVVGSPNDGQITGAAFVFVRGNGSWQLEQRLTSTDPLVNALGRRVAIDDTRIALSSPWYGQTLGHGAVLSFRRSGGTWGLEHTLTAAPRQFRANVGMALALSGSRVFAGAPHEDGPGSDAGAVHIWDLDGCRVGATYCGPAAANSTGARARIAGVGSAWVADADLTLFAEGLPAGALGYFLVGSDQGVFSPPGSGGLICIGCTSAANCAGVGRFNRPEELIAGPRGRLAVDLGALPLRAATAVQSGETWNFQCWYSDSGVSRFSDALSVDFR